MSGPQTPAGRRAADAARASEARPALRVVRGNPSAEEIAAVVAILSAVSGGAEGSHPASRLFGWASRAPRMRVAHLHGPGAWRSGSIPR